VSDLPMLWPAAPEILLALTAMGLMMLGVFNSKDMTRPVTNLAVIAMIVAGILVLARTSGRVTTFNDLFVIDGFGTFVKILILSGSAITLLMALSFLHREKETRFEYPVLVVFATLGMMMMVSANDLMSLYLGLETQSLALYVLAGYQRDSAKATEAGLKYFVLGSLASGMLLYGASMIYGFSGTTNFEGLAQVLSDGSNIGAIIGVVFVLAGLAFKVSAVPFHMWTPDVYEGAPTQVTAFFAVAPKIAAVALLVRVMVGPFGHMQEQWQQVVVFISIASMIVGAFAAISQTNIKRLMAYSSIGHVGYALVGVAVGDAVGVRGVLVYLAIYLIMNVGTFAIIMSMRQRGRAVEGIADLAGLSKSHPMMALALAIFMFSMAGIPPLAGFWGKFYIFMAAIDANMIALAVIGVLTSVVSAFYYLRIIKVMYFDEASEPLDKPLARTAGVVMSLSALVILLFTIVPQPLLTSAEAAAASLFGG
jgi:NADH-quinone oxidoreductase subunit N